MYELEYVKKRKRRQTAGIIAIVTTVGLVVLIIIAFLGRYVGTFTVALDSSNVKLIMADEHTFLNPTSFLRIDELPSFEEYSFYTLPGYSTSEENLDWSILDSDNPQDIYGELANRNASGQITSINAFKYTFYVKNIGTSSARYNFTFKIIDQKADTDGRTLDDTIRVMFFENSMNEESHDYKVYAKSGRSDKRDDEGKLTRREYVTVSPEKATSDHPYLGLAEEFYNSTTIIRNTNKIIEQEEIIRYTVVIWLEGEDPDSDPLLEAPKGATIKLGVEINAYEN